MKLQNTGEFQSSPLKRKDCSYLLYSGVLAYWWGIKSSFFLRPRKSVKGIIFSTDFSPSTISYPTDLPVAFLYLIPSFTNASLNLKSRLCSFVSLSKFTTILSINPLRYSFLSCGDLTDLPPKSELNFFVLFVRKISGKCVSM